jgi:SOS-response transcriptional repressor LexA
MKTITQMNLDVYLYIKQFEDEKGYCPSYREIQENTNYKSIASIKEAVYKLIDLKFLFANFDDNGRLIGRTIKVIDNEETRKQIKELREKYE